MGQHRGKQQPTKIQRPLFIPVAVIMEIRQGLYLVSFKNMKSSENSVSTCRCGPESAFLLPHTDVLLSSLVLHENECKEKKWRKNLLLSLIVSRAASVWKVSNKTVMTAEEIAWQHMCFPHSFLEICLHLWLKFLGTLYNDMHPSNRDGGGG